MAADPAPSELDLVAAALERPRPGVDPTTRPGTLVGIRDRSWRELLRTTLPRVRRALTALG